MKQTGYGKNYAGAVESTASLGGMFREHPQILDENWLKTRRSF
jgi:hypothetical protein